MIYFSPSEFDQPGLPGSGSNMDRSFIAKLDNARRYAGIPFAIVRGGGWRSEDYQREIYRNMGLPPVLNSYHLKGRAADIRYNSEGDLYKIIDACFKAGMRGFGINSGAIHVDDRVSYTPIVWGYSKTKNTRLYRDAKQYIESLPAHETKATTGTAFYALPLLLASSFLLYRAWK